MNGFTQLYRCKLLKHVSAVTTQEKTMLSGVRANIVPSRHCCHLYTNRGIDAMRYIHRSHVWYHGSILCRARSPNKGSDEDERWGGEGPNATQALNIALPIAGFIVLVLLGAPFLGPLVPYLGVVIGLVAVAAVTGTLDKVSVAYGVDPLTAASGIAGIGIGVLLIPAFLKLGFFLLAGFFLLNFLVGRSADGGAFQSQDIDASKAIIDVDAETVDSVDE